MTGGLGNWRISEEKHILDSIPAVELFSSGDSYLVFFANSFWISETHYREKKANMHHLNLDIVYKFLVIIGEKKPIYLSKFSFV